MFSLTICFGPAATSWTLLYKDAEKAKAAFALMLECGEAGSIATVDDFGQQVFVRPDCVKGMMLEDMSLAIEAQVERGLHQARAQAKAEVRAMTDPVIKEGLQRRNQGPAIYQPGMNGRMS